MVILHFCQCDGLWVYMEPVSGYQISSNMPNFSVVKAYLIWYSEAMLFFVHTLQVGVLNPAYTVNFLLVKMHFLGLITFKPNLTVKIIG